MIRQKKTSPLLTMASARRSLYGAFILAALAVTYAQGQVDATSHSSALRAENAQPGAIDFSVASVRPDNRKDGRWNVGFRPNGYIANNVTLHQFIQEAFGVFEEDLIEGIPKWADQESYDIDAKVDDADESAFAQLSLDQRRLLLQKLLADRFGLKTHFDYRERPIYSLVIAKYGPKLQESRADYRPPINIRGAGGVIKRGRPGQFTVEWESMDYFARYLSGSVDRHVENDTGLTGHYDFQLDWTPENNAKPLAGAAGLSETADAPSGPSIFTALREQLGLELKPKKGRVEVLVIDHVEQPTAN